MNSRKWQRALAAALGASALLPAALPAVETRESVVDFSLGPARETGGSGAYTVASFELKSRWNRGLILPLKAGDRWTPAKQSEVLAAVQRELNGEATFSHLWQQAEMASVLYVSIDEQKEEVTHTVHLIIRPLRVKVSLAKFGDNFLPLPRSASPTLYQYVPRPLLALHPTFGVSYDQAVGTTFSAGMNTDLLTLPATAANRPPSSENSHHLGLLADYGRSTQEFYREHAELNYTHLKPGGAWREVFLGVHYEEGKGPLATSEHATESGGVEGGLTFKLGAHTRLTFHSGYQRASDEVATRGTIVSAHTDVHAIRVTVESLLSQPVGGFLRASLWEDNGWTDGDFGAHQRLVARVGYVREIALSDNQTLGIELIGGAGYLWGDAPASRRFFGGNSPNQFLYENLSGSGLREMPGGPLLRSFGENQAVVRDSATRGGNGFWHINLNFTLPIRRWSLPLIPADEEMRTQLKSGINITGRNFLIATLKNQGMSREDAVAEADRTLAEIRPSTAYIIDEANLYSVKPLIMFDAAGLSGSGNESSWLAAGGGIQVNVVTAKFELGYMRTLQGPIAANRRGNVFFRLVFQNLF